MAILNGKYTGFDPLITTEEMFYSLLNNYPYTANFRVKGDYGNKYTYVPELKHVIFDGSSARLLMFAIEGAPQLEKISFVNGSLAYWTENSKLYGSTADARASTVKEINFESCDENWLFNTYAELQYFPHVEKISVFAGWNFNLVCLSPDLTVQSIIDIIQNLGIVETAHTLRFANTSEVPAEYIQLATSKGWTIS